MICDGMQDAEKGAKMYCVPLGICVSVPKKRKNE